MPRPDAGRRENPAVPRASTRAGAAAVVMNGRRRDRDLSWFPGLRERVRPPSGREGHGPQQPGRVRQLLVVRHHTEQVVHESQSCGEVQRVQRAHAGRVQAGGVLEDAGLCAERPPLAHLPGELGALGLLPAGPRGGARSGRGRR